MIDSGKLKKIAKYVGYVLVVVCVIFIVKALKDLKWQSLTILSHPWTAVGYTLAAAVAFAVNVYISSFGWKLILEFLYGKKIAYAEIRDVYVRANVGKYLPGNVMHFAGRNMLGKKLGFSHIDMALSTIIEVITLLFTACLLSLIFAFNSVADVVRSAFTKINPLVLIAAFIAVAAVIICAIIYVHKKGYLRKYQKLFTLSFLRIFLILFLIYGLTLLIPGFILVMIFTNILGLTLTIHTALLILAGSMMSWMLGYVMIGSPGGIGIKEYVLMLLLGSVCGPSPTTVAALLHRLASIIGDIIAYLVELSLSKKASHKKIEEEKP